MKQILKFTALIFAVLMFTASCNKDKIPLYTPVADAGKDQVVQSDINTVTITGTGTSKNGPIVGYLWSLVSGPNVPIITNPSAPTTTVRNLVAGTYLLQFAVIDDAGLTGVDTVSIVVNPAVQVVISLQPSNNPNEGHDDSYNVVGGPDTEIELGSWTIYGLPYSWRSYVKFDQSQIPSNATIVSAILYLYATPNPHSGDGVDAMTGPANAAYVQRITNAWSVPTLNWNSLPATTTANQASIPQATSSFENAIVDVTSIVQDMQTSSNYGFALQLQNESVYNFRAYASSFYSDSTLHPKLVITYK